MRSVCAEITLVLTILRIWAPIYAKNGTSDKTEEHQSSLLQVNGSRTTSFYHKLVKRCWNSVISGRPTLSRVVVAGSSFIFFALAAGLSLFFYIYCRHKEQFAEIEEDLLTGKRCFKPQLEDLEMGLTAAHVAKPVSFMKKMISNKIRKIKDHKKEDEGSDDDEDDEMEDMTEDDASENEDEDIEKLNTPSPRGLSKTQTRKKRDQMRDEDDNEGESQGHDGDPRQTTKNETMVHGKSKAGEGKEHQKMFFVQKPKTEKGESSVKSDPTKKSKKPGDHEDHKTKGKSDHPDPKKKETGEKQQDKKKAAGKFTTVLGKKTEAKAKKAEKGAKKTEKTKAPKVKAKKQEKKVKKVKIKPPKPTKIKTKKVKKEKKPKKPKKK